jgi:hypothetical protein
MIARSTPVSVRELNALFTPREREYKRAPSAHGTPPPVQVGVHNGPTWSHNGPLAQ